MYYVNLVLCLMPLFQRHFKNLAFAAALKLLVCAIGAVRESISY